MTREELFRAMGKVREDQIEAAEAVKKQTHPWRRFGALAACLALIVTAVGAAPWIEGQIQWKAIIYSFNPNDVIKEEDLDSWKMMIQPFDPQADAGGGTGTGSVGDMDGCDYQGAAEPLRPNYSWNVEIGELAGPGNGSGMMSGSSCMAYLTPEEIFEKSTVIFRGIIENLQYYQVEMDALGMKTYCTRALVRVTDSIRGDLTEGETCALLYMGAKGYMSTSISGALEDLAAGSEAIFMPIPTDRFTGWKERDNGYFCYADLAEFYLSEGLRCVFADTGEGLEFDRYTYQEISEAETLDNVSAYIRKMIAETAQPAAAPVEPQPEPSETRQANQEEIDSSYIPNGARELPGGAYVGE